MGVALYRDIKQHIIQQILTANSVLECHISRKNRENAFFRRQDFSVQLDCWGLVFWQTEC